LIEKLFPNSDLLEGILGVFGVFLVVSKQSKKPSMVRGLLQFCIFFCFTGIPERYRYIL
jgi:hypothetical protein